jgi:hypothetical protein
MLPVIDKPLERMKTALLNWHFFALKKSFQCISRWEEASSTPAIELLVRDESSLGRY